MTEVKSVNWRLVEAGRIVLINRADNKSTQGKLAVIAEIVDHGRVLIDGPTTGVARQVANLKHVTLTPHVVEGVKRGMKSKTIKAKVEASPAFKEWSESSWAKKIAQRERRRQLSDFERFQVMVHRRERKAALAKAVAKA
ncbi:60S ribosomal protein [Yarrowia sp. B02]|nr:60S ribosomal protein [Yarrowia sp. B02]